MGGTRERRHTMDAKRLDLEAIKQDWQESRWSFASRGGWAENYALALIAALEAAWKETERLRELLDDANDNYEHCVGTNARLLPYKEAAEAYIATSSLDAFRHLRMVVHKNRQGRTKQEAPNSSG
jgi:hypothetical protein